MNARTAALDVLETLELPYWVTGSYALSLTGYGRTTADTDIVVDVAAATYEASLRPALEARGLYVAALMQVGDRAVGQASAGATWVDLILPAPGIWTTSCRERRVRVPDPVIGRHIWIVSPEDLVLAKLAWARGGSARQVEDATRISPPGRSTSRIAGRWRRTLASAAPSRGSWRPRMPAERAPRPMTDHERETWSWFARWAVIVRAFAIAEREGVPVGPQRLRRARQILDPHATEPMLDALIAHLQRRQEAGERDVFDAPSLVDIVGPALAVRIVDAGLVDGSVATQG